MKDNISIYIHGVPSAHDIYSNTSEYKDQYCHSFYGTKYDNQTFVIETRVFQNKIICYYTFIVNGTITFEGRPGGYFGITIVSDLFYKDLKTIYNLIDIVLRNKVIGTILSKENISRYLVTSFSEKGKDICDYLLNLLASTNIEGIQLDDSFIANAKPQIKIHPSSIDNVDIVNTYKSIQRLIITPEAQTDSEKKLLEEFAQKMEYVKLESEKRISKVNEELQSSVQMRKRLELEIMNIRSKSNSDFEEKEKIEKKMRSMEFEKQKVLSEFHNIQTLYREIESKCCKLQFENAKLQKIMEEMALIFNEFKVSPSKKQIQKDEQHIDISRPKSNKVFLLSILNFFLLAVIIVLIVTFHFISAPSVYDTPCLPIVL